MFAQPPVFSPVPTGVVDLTYDFAPLFVGLVVGLCLCVLAFAAALGVYDTWRPRREKRLVKRAPIAPEASDAA
ncbi:MAG TPA: hypothetical protein VNN62_06100 [Methylomirabilota bacterium]|jgi:hypothetical protein|nr:hypothetical protein [Methylomirabilota bacterium]